MILEKCAEDFHQISARIPLPIEGGPVRLHIKATWEIYHFYYSLGDSSPVHIADASTRFLACEVAGRSFTGVYCGVFATGKGKNCVAPAFFDYFLLKSDHI